MKFGVSQANSQVPSIHVITFAMGLRHNRRRSNVFGDARFWLCPNL